MTSHCKHQNKIRYDFKKQLSLPHNWTPKQAWAVVEILEIISTHLWDIYEDKFLDHLLHKRRNTSNENIKQQTKKLPKNNKNKEKDLPF